MDDQRLNNARHFVRHARRSVDRHYDKMDAIEDWNEKDRYQRSAVFVGARDWLISAQEQYIKLLEEQLGLP